jgi:hypothetical protein
LCFNAFTGSILSSSLSETMLSFAAVLIQRMNKFVDAAKVNLRKHRKNRRVASVRAAMEEAREALFKKAKSKFYWYDFTVR